MSLVFGGVEFLVLVLLVPGAIRIVRQRNAIITIIAIAVAVHVAMTLAAAVLLSELDYWQSASVYWFLTVILIYAYGTCYRSLSVQMLLVVAGTPSGAIDLRTLRERYFARFMRDRVDALVEGGRAELHQESLVATDIGRAGAARILSARRIFGLNASRLYYGKPAADAGDGDRLGADSV